MWELDIKKAEYWRTDAFWTVVLEKTLESPWDSKKIKPVNPKGNQPRIFIGRTEAPVLWPPIVKNWLIREDPDAGKIEGRRRRRQQKIRCLDGITKSMDMSLSKPEACFILLKHVSQYIKLQCKCFWVRKRELISLLYFLSFLKLTLKSVLFFLVSL